jgi:murein L,D-transpeptidase YcbB/YkuD
LIAPIFNKHGWFWGAGFRTEDAMHFECGLDLVHKFVGVGRPDLETISALDLGDRGSRVKILQELLVRSGMDVAVDGVYGIATRSAVMEYQARNGLMVDGIAGAKTVASLANAHRA